MKLLTSTIDFLQGFGYRQPACGLSHVLSHVQAFCLGQLKVV